MYGERLFALKAENNFSFSFLQKKKKMLTYFYTKQFTTRTPFVFFVLHVFIPYTRNTPKGLAPSKPIIYDIEHHTLVEL